MVDVGGQEQVQGPYRQADRPVQRLSGGARREGQWPSDAWRKHRRPGRTQCRIRRTAGSDRKRARPEIRRRSEEHTSELQSLMRISYAVFCLKKKKQNTTKTSYTVTQEK